MVLEINNRLAALLEQAGIIVSAQQLAVIELGLALLLVLVISVLYIRLELGYRQLKQNHELLLKEQQDLKTAFAAQDAAISAETALRQKVEESLRNANRLTEAANHAKTEFMATIGHEIRTPLNGIVPILDMLSETKLDAEQLQMVQTAAQSSLHLLRLINDILDFSKAEVGKLEIENIELNLKVLIYSITDLMKQSAENKGLELKVIIAPDVPLRLRGDSLRLKQIITNLLSNALKFTDKGRISLEVSLTQEHAREVDLLFAVKDTGIGMSESVSNKLFHSFTQADASTTRTHGGTGLGLAICKRLVELMGGDIGVKSVEGKGSTFWFTLPMRKSLKDIPALRERLEDAHILYYLKNRNKDEVHDLIKTDCKLQLSIADDFGHATELLKTSFKPGENNFIDLVVVDVLGSEFTAHSDVVALKKILSGTFTQILVINALPTHIKELKKAGADAVMVRPFKVEAFRQQVFRLLDIGLSESLRDKPEDALILGGAYDHDLFEVDHHGDAQQVKAASLKFSGNVLLAEDNPINRAVIEKMLKLFGLEVETADDGYQALKKMKENQYDLVFMDCQMPRMDGYQATRLWRDYEEQHKSDLNTRNNIIAITANAMREDRQKCIDAQMDDYLPKPISRNSLGIVLKVWLPPERMHEVEEIEITSEVVAEKSDDRVLDEELLLELKQVMGTDFENIVQSYLKHSTQMLTEIKHSQDDGDLENIQKLAHSFKSSSKNVGAIALGDLALQIEQQLKQKDASNLDDMIRQLIVSYDQVARALKKQISG